LIAKTHNRAIQFCRRLSSVRLVAKDSRSITSQTRKTPTIPLFGQRKFLIFSITIRIIWLSEFKLSLSELQLFGIFVAVRAEEELAEPPRMLFADRDPAVVADACRFIVAVFQDAIPLWLFSHD